MGTLSLHFSRCLTRHNTVLEKGFTGEQEATYPLVTPQGPFFVKSLHSAAPSDLLAPFLGLLFGGGGPSLEGDWCPSSSQERRSLSES